MGHRTRGFAKQATALLDSERAQRQPQTEKPATLNDAKPLLTRERETALKLILGRCLQNKFLFDYASIASGTTFSELKIINLKNLKILSPPIELQAAFSSRISAIERLRLAQHRAQSEAELLFMSLQHSAFRGELAASSLKEAAA